MGGLDLHLITHKLLNPKAIMRGSRRKQGVCKGLEKNIQGQNRKGLALISGTVRHNKSQQ